MKLLLMKLIVLLLCVPVYPFYVIIVTNEHKSYYGIQSTYKKVSREYWKDVKDVLTYKEAE